MTAIRSYTPTPDYQPRPFVVTMEEREESGPKMRVRIAAAIGRWDAMRQAQDKYPECVALTAEEAS